MTPGRASGRVTRENVRQRPAPRSFDASRSGRADPVEGDEQRQDHQRQIVVDHAEQHRGARVEDLERPPSPPIACSSVRDPPFGGEDHLPADRAHQEVRPERHEHERDQDAASCSRAPFTRHPVRDRRPDHEAQRGAGDPDPQRVQERRRRTSGRAPRRSGRTRGCRSRGCRTCPACSRSCTRRPSATGATKNSSQPHPRRDRER